MPKLDPDLNLMYSIVENLSCVNFWCGSVDDLQSIDALEEYVAASALVLVMLGSPRYFKSANCLRELQAAQKGHKPLCLLHESDPEKNGTPLSELKAVCTAELRAFVFDDRVVLPWLRIRDFQVVTLVAVAEQVLLQSPSYAGRITLPLKLPGDLRESSLTLPERVLLFVSGSNPGAEEVASELQRCTEAMANQNSLASWRRSSSNSRQRASTEAARSTVRSERARRCGSDRGKAASDRTTWLVHPSMDGH